MIDKTMSCAIEPLLPVELGSGKIKFAQGVKAGRWVFATGLMAQDFVNGVAPDVLLERAPHSGAPKREKEALRGYEDSPISLRSFARRQSYRCPRPACAETAGQTDEPP